MEAIRYNGAALGHEIKAQPPAADGQAAALKHRCAGEEMNPKLRSGMKYFAVFILGLLVGAVLLESLERNVRPFYKEIIMTELKIEQEFMASRASRENKPFVAAFHRWAAVSAESEDGFRSINDRIHDNSYFFPFQMYVLRMIASPEGVQKGKKIVEGLDRGKLAVAFETLGQTEEAEKQWLLAQQLMRRPSMEATKKSVYSLLGQEKTELQQKAEDAVLGVQKK